VFRLGLIGTAARNRSFWGKGGGGGNKFVGAKGGDWGALGRWKEGPLD